MQDEWKIWNLYNILFVYTLPYDEQGGKRLLEFSKPYTCTVNIQLHYTYRCTLSLPAGEDGTCAIKEEEEW